MVQSKRQMFVVIGAFALVMILGTVTYAFFNYTRTGASNVIKVGKISFNSEQGQSINLTNIFPIDVLNGIPDDNTKVGSVIVHITGDTTQSEGIEYLVSAINVQNIVGSKSLPISIDVSVANNTTNDPDTNLGTSDEDYFTDRGPNAISSIYKVLANDTINNNDQLLVGYIKSGATGVDGNIVIKAYINKEKVVISDTYPAENGDANNDGYLDGTPSSFGENKTVFTTTEWNSLQTNGISFQIKVEANEGIWVEQAPICKRVVNVENLHFEKCTYSDSEGYCQADGYGLDENIIYGNAVSIGTDILNPGDAFDCKVSSNGDYTERFYYVSPYFDTENKVFDNTYATLIYYSNTLNGILSDGGTGYYLNNYNYNNYSGPVSALPNLPTINTWDNIKLKNTSRSILAEYESMHNYNSVNGGTNLLPTDYSYDGYAARLLTAQELMHGCGLERIPTYTSGELSNCKFLFEGTTYATSSKLTYGIWLETPRGSNSSDVYNTDTYDRNIYSSPSSNIYGIRPAIDVPVSRILK